MSNKSLSKGKRGERMWAAYLRKRWGLNARRGTNNTGQADVIDETDVHWEVKHRERLEIFKATDQAVRDAGDSRVPVVAFRRNNGDWFVAMRADDIERFLEEVTITPIQETADE